ncbi:MAG: histidinol-phosphatase [Planctomycetales bacterium]|nr:histidinol-phosphatase [Planctomycetales bacterium]NIM07857.1 histidinol-phosphatase [Planctomycetales bacterium]NIN07346.1 histidinol-phosphatase [Planctomycetales bacterium]NIN76450.1 histidinol-phosphatase [Planctomycetales bacterium]NIO35390.1 histidinol-phosphatase [Planctomycetales bacterium]
MPAELDPLLARYQLAQQIAVKAGQLTLRYFRDGEFEVERKLDGSPVTVADRSAEELLRRHITEQFADDRIVGEEWPEKAGSSGYCWVLDPIDGTHSFVSGVPLYSTLIGITCAGVPQVGVINIPALHEMVHAATGHGAWYLRGDHPPCPARVSDTRQLSEGLFCTSEVKTFTQRQRLHVYQRLEERSRLTRTWGDGYGYLLVATGRAELMVDPELQVWDAAALQPVLQEAGGTFTDWEGRATIESGEGIATNGHVLDEVLAITRGQ